jgi:hypothetical protein
VKGREGAGREKGREESTFLAEINMRIRKQERGKGEEESCREGERQETCASSSFNGMCLISNKLISYTSLHARRCP